MPTKSQSSPAGPCRPPSVICRLTSALWLLPLAWLWFVLINHLRVEWSLNEQYSYGWAVPFLCLFLLWRSATSKAESRKPKAENPIQVSGFRFQRFSLPHLPSSPSSPMASSPSSILDPPSSPSGPLPSSPSSIFHLLFWLLALLYLPTRLIEVANPDWRLVSWALALEVVGITLIFFQMQDARRQQSAVSGQWSVVSGQTSVLRPPSSAVVFPLCFFLVSVPWPTLIEYPITQSLMRMDVGATCELAGWLGIPALPHGNVIEVAGGQVGIDEACSGIRSFQATLMISLFLGEFYRLNVWRRAFCVGFGFALALLLNLIRQLVLVWVAATKGVPAIAEWHDPTGVIILLGCFFGLWGVGHWLAKREARGATKRLRDHGQRDKETGTQENIQHPIAAPESETPSSILHPPSSPSGPVVHPPSSIFHLPSSIPLALAAWLLLVETGVEGWYRWHEARLPAPVTWRIEWPKDVPLNEVLIAPRTRQILRYDEGQNYSWQEDGHAFQAIYLRWNPGSVAVRLAENHTPATCMPTAGHNVSQEHDLQLLNVKGLELPFRIYKIDAQSKGFFIAYCLWEDRAQNREFSRFLLTRLQRFAPVLAGERNLGQRSLEISITGVNDFAECQTVLVKLLNKLVTPD